MEEQRRKWTRMSREGSGRRKEAAKTFRRQYKWMEWELL